MKRSLLSLLQILFFCAPALAQKPANDDCKNAIFLEDLSSRGIQRSIRQEYTNDGATASGVSAASGWASPGNDVWFKFTARESAFNTTVTGFSLNGILQYPLVALYKTADFKTYEEIPGKKSYYKEVSASLSCTDLKFGETYYIRVSGANNNKGTFAMFCTNTKKVPLAGADYESAMELCSRELIVQEGFSGAGKNNREAAGSVFDKRPKPETNSLWFKFTAANSENFYFTIQPNGAISNEDNYDFMVYDLGTDPQARPNSGNMVRGSAAMACPQFSFLPTGLNQGVCNDREFGQYRDCEEQARMHYNCLPRGTADFLPLIKGHTYAILVDTDVPPENNGFALDFLTYTSNTFEFEGPKAIADIKVDQPCTVGQNYTFTSLSTGATSVKWTFDDDAVGAALTDKGPFKVGFSKPGNKTVILEAFTAGGCSVKSYYTFSVGVTPAKPEAKSDKAVYCTSDTIALSTPQLPYNTYYWTGPNNYKAEGATVYVPVTDGSVAGVYTLVARQGTCESVSTSLTIPAIVPAPQVAFTASPSPPAKLLLPVKVTFVNQSAGADSYLWTFGDGASSTEFSPTHSYQKAGVYNVKLSGIKAGVCTISVIKGEFTITAETALFVPNTFTPNGDGINDEFKISISTMNSFLLRVYNRWGKLVYQSVNADEHWDGRFNSQAVPAGTYYYKLKGIDQKNNTIEKSGAVTVLR